MFVFILSLLSLILSLVGLLIFFKKLDFNISKNGLWILGLLLVVSFLLSAFLSPLSHRFFMDESFYMGGAKNIVATGDLVLDSMDYPKQPAWPLILSIPFFFEVSSNVAIWFTLFISLLGILAFYYLSRLLYDENRALFVTSLYTLFALRIFWSASAETAMVSSLFVFLSLALMLVAFRKDDWQLYLLSIILVGFTFQIRSENLLLVLPFLFLCWKHKRLKWIFSLLIPFIIASLYNAYSLRNFYVRAYQGSISFFSFPNLDWYLILGVFAIGVLVIRRQWFVLSFAAPLWLYTQVYAYSDTFHVLPAMSLFLLALIPLRKFMGVVMACFLIWSLMFSYSIDPNFEYQTNLLNELELPEDCMLVSERPVIYQSVYDYKSFTTRSFLLKPQVGCVYYIEDMFCKENYFDVNSTSRCDDILELNWKVEKVFEGNFTLYRYDNDT